MLNRVEAGILAPGLGHVGTSAAPAADLPGDRLDQVPGMGPGLHRALRRLDQQGHLALVLPGQDDHAVPDLLRELIRKVPQGSPVRAVHPEAEQLRVPDLLDLFRRPRRLVVGRPAL